MVSPSESFTVQQATRCVDHGYVILRGFLTPEEIDVLARDYEAQRKLPRLTPYGPSASKEAVGRLAPRLNSVMAALQNVAPGSMAPKHVAGGTYFATNDLKQSKRPGLSQGLPWHMDHDSFYMFQGHRNYVHVYIAIVKPDPAKGNLHVVPKPCFQKHCPDVWREIEFGGAQMFVTHDGKPTIRDDYRGRMIEIPFNLDDVKETPELSPGDAMVMRGDLFHKTQDMNTARVNLSVRLVDFSHMQTREHFAVTCPFKDLMLGKGIPGSPHDIMTRVFAKYDSISTLSMLTRMGKFYEAVASKSKL